MRWFSFLRPLSFAGAAAGGLALTLAADARADWPLEPTATPSVVATSCGKFDLRCQRGPFVVTKTEKIGADFDFDTGWLPKDAAVQVRLLAYLHGRTRVDLGGTVDATWPDPLRLTPKGTAATGLLAIDDGFVVKAQARFTVKVAGKTYSWTGDIPGVPKVDLATVATTAFDPFAFAGSGLPPIKTSGKTKPLELYKLDITDSIIPIPGIGGGFQLEGEAEFAADYQTLRVAFDELVSKGTVPDVTATNPFTKLALASSPGVDTTMNVHGQLGQQTTLHFVPGFFFEILGSKFSVDLVDIPVALPRSEKAWDFDPVAFRFPLPRIEARPSPIELGNIPVGKETSVLVTVFDTGEAALSADADDPTKVAVVTTKHLDIAAGTTESLRATITPAAPGPIETAIVVQSNDPFSPKLTIKIRGQAGDGAAPPADTETAAAGGCGCRFGDRADRSSLVLAVVVGGLLVRRRRR